MQHIRPPQVRNFTYCLWARKATLDRLLLDLRDTTDPELADDVAAAVANGIFANDCIVDLQVRLPAPASRRFMSTLRSAISIRRPGCDRPQTLVVEPPPTDAQAIEELASVRIRTFSEFHVPSARATAPRRQTRSARRGRGRATPCSRRRCPGWERRKHWRTCSSCP